MLKIRTWCYLCGKLIDDDTGAPYAVRFETFDTVIMHLACRDLFEKQLSAFKLCLKIAAPEIVALIRSAAPPC